jgi:phosphotransferase system enzyme I (PtsI)
LFANIELPGDVPAALDGGAEGVGLFRTEFLFLDRGDMPDEREQYEAYKKVVKGMEGRPVTIRTFDLGNDKDIHPDEIGDRVKTNPALGRRAIRLSLAEPRMFQTQLRAILRATKYGPIKLLIPMLAHAHEIDQTLAALEQAKSSLRGEKVPFDENIEVGGMIEIPAAALAVGLFLRRLDFLSIGTNDLIQYTLAIDRSDEQVSSLYDPLHPAVLMLIAHTLASAEKVGIPVSVCGEMAGDPKMTRLLLGMGLRIFSMHPSQILKVKSRVLKADVNEIVPSVRRMLRLDEPAKLREALERLNAKARQISEHGWLQKECSRARVFQGRNRDPGEDGAGTAQAYCAPSSFGIRQIVARQFVAFPKPLKPRKIRPRLSTNNSGSVSWGIAFIRWQPRWLSLFPHHPSGPRRR